jgi:hypothetical protein
MFSPPRIWESLISQVQVKIEDSSWLKRRLYQWALPVGYEMADTRFRKEEPGAGLKLRYFLADWLVFQMIKDLERTGDHAVLIANDILEFKKPVKKDIVEKIQDMNEFALSVLDDSCLALFKEDYVQAEKTIEKTNEILKYERKVRDASKSLKDDEEIYRIRRMTENIRRISEYASDIAEIVLNMNIEKSLKKTT